MTEKAADQQDSLESFPGLRLPLFKQGAELLDQMITKGDYFLFVSWPSYAKLIDKPEAFAHFKSKFGKQIGEPDVSDEKARRALNEIVDFIQFSLWTSESGDALSFLIERVFEDALKNTSEEQKAEFREELEAKLSTIDALGFAKNLPQRTQRLAVAVGPCLEDVDFDLVTERRASREDLSSVQPFIKLRIRYVAREDQLFPFSFIGSPWGRERPPSNGRSFELECDESDIDLLILRLVSAKQFLLEGMKKRTSITKGLDE